MVTLQVQNQQLKEKYEVEKQQNQKYRVCKKEKKNPTKMVVLTEKHFTEKCTYSLMLVVWFSCSDCQSRSSCRAKCAYVHIYIMYVYQHPCLDGCCWFWAHQYSCPLVDAGSHGTAHDKPKAWWPPCPASAQSVERGTCWDPNSDRTVAKAWNR